MYKYYEEIENKEPIILNDPGKSNYIDVTYTLPPQFFIKNKDIFTELRKIYDQYKYVTDDFIYKKLEGKMEDHEIYDYIDIHQRLYLTRPDNNNYDGYYFIDDFYKTNKPDNHSCEYYLNEMIKIIKIIMVLFPEHNDYYEPIYNDTKKLYDELVKKNKVLLMDDHITLELPNAWYITKDGTLYNSMGNDGHKHSNLMYAANEIKKSFLLPDLYKEFIKKYQENYIEIEERGYITRDQYVHYLNWYGKSKMIYDDRIYHKRIVSLVLGIIKAHIELYKAFDKVEEANDYVESINKIFELTNNNIDDLFVRFVGMHKVKICTIPFVCTTNTSEILFKEYTDRGFMLDLVDPIVVKDGEVKEIDLEDHRKLRRILR